MRIYTINTNNYIEDLQAPAWVEVITNVEDLGDPVRSSRKDKILCPFEEPSVYVDASKVHLLNSNFLDLCDEIFSEHDFFVMKHPHQHSYLEECAEYVHRGWVDEKTLFDYTRKIKGVYNFSKHFSPLCTILWRKNSKEFNEAWWYWYNLGGIRDQLSASVALQLSGIKYGWEESRKLLNKFTDASPDGIWWNNKCGAYQYSDPKDPGEFVNTLCELTGLSKFRYRTRLSGKGDLLIGKT